MADAPCFIEQQFPIARVSDLVLLDAFYHRFAWHPLSWTIENPWLNEISELDPWGYRVVLNAGVGRKKGTNNLDLCVKIRVARA